MSFCKGKEEHLADILRRQNKVNRKENGCCVIDLQTIAWQNTIDDGKEKLQIIKFYDFTNSGTDIVDQLNDYHTTRSNSCRWVMVALSCMLDTARVESMGKPYGV